MNVYGPDPSTRVTVTVGDLQELFEEGMHFAQHGWEYMPRVMTQEEIAAGVYDDKAGRPLPPALG